MSAPQPSASPLRAARFLSRWPFRRSFAPLLLAVAVAAQLVTYERWLQPVPTAASGYAASTALGLLHGRGLTVTQDEARRFRAADRNADALAFYDPEAERGPAHEPLPGASLLFAGVALASGALRQSTIVYLQMVLHGLAAVWLALELRYRSGLAATFAGLGWALFVPEYRSTLVPGYDSLTALLSVCAVVPWLRYLRTGASVGPLLAGLACGIGLWTRDYLFVLPIVLLAVLVGLRRIGPWALALFLGPVLVLGAGLAWARAPETGATQRFVRGGVWHSFWAGVGQFPNEVGVTDEDETIQAFAARLAPGEDFQVPNFQYLPSYGAVLEREAHAWIPAHLGELARNALHRLLWLLCPSFGPSRHFAAGLARLALAAGGIPVTLAALVGFALAVRRDPAWALVLASPWIALLPLVPYYFITKVPTAVFFVQLGFAGIALDGAIQRFFPRGSATSAD
jgi:hypothetical protein